jgi:amino acid adenylation domain-containing protein
MTALLPDSVHADASPDHRALERQTPLVADRTLLDHLPPAEQELFERFGQGPIEPLPYHLIHRAFEAQAQSQPTATAIDHLGRQITYADLNQQADRLARVLADHGVQSGDNVALFLRRSIELVIGQLAAMKLGAAYVPQHVGVAPESQLRHVLDATNASVVLTLAEFVDQIPTKRETVIALDDFFVTGHDEASERPFQADCDISPDENCFILFTSGTTGNPNGVQVTHRNVCNILLPAPGNLGMGPGLKVAQILSISFDMAAWETLGALMNGATLLIRGSSIQETVQRADIVIATPSILGSIDADACHNVKVAAVAGEPCPRPLADAWGAFATFHNSCGPTETTIINTAQHYQPGLNGLTIGTPTPNNTVYVLDENRVPCRIGEVGEMWAGGDCVTAGYLDNPSLTAERYAPDPFLGGGRMMFRTRDLGRWTQEGELEHYGRTDDQVKVRGFRVELDSVSAALESVDGCTKAVTLKHDSRSLVAFVQPETVDIDKALAAVAQRLPYYCVPAKVTAMAELPRTSRGKVDKRALAETIVDADIALSENQDVNLDAGQVEHRPPETTESWPVDPRPEQGPTTHEQVSI